MDAVWDNEVARLSDTLCLWDYDDCSEKYKRKWTKVPRPITFITNRTDPILFALIQNECVDTNALMFCITLDLHCVSYKFFLRKLLHTKVSEFGYHLLAMYTAPN